MDILVKYVVKTVHFDHYTIEIDIKKHPAGAGHFDHSIQGGNYLQFMYETKYALIVVFLFYFLGF